MTDPPVPRDPEHDTVAALLARATGNDRRAARELLPLVYAELRRVAAEFLQREHRGHTLQPTALVHEAWLRLGDQGFSDRTHFLAATAVAMRRVLVDHARRRAAHKRGAGKRVTLHTDDAASFGRDLQVLELDDLLARLAALSERKARLVELRFFAGMTLEDAARVLGVARSTAADDWAVARAWLAHELQRGARR